MARKRTLERPYPPQELFDRVLDWSMPGQEVMSWVQEAILTKGGPLYNEDHQHLVEANIGFIWTTSERVKAHRRVLGMAEIPTFRCNAWQKARQQQQLTEWFGLIPDFLITLDANYSAEASDAEFAALVEHELYHCAQDKDAFGEPRFSRDTGEPIWAIRGHDVEEFIGVVRRYGVGPRDGALAQLVEAGDQAPEISNLNIARACGICQIKAA